jgi:hypothetical protein
MEQEEKSRDTTGMRRPNLNAKNLEEASRGRDLLALGSPTGITEAVLEDSD